jgi:hypothetical protein
LLEQSSNGDTQVTPAKFTVIACCYNLTPQEFCARLDRVASSLGVHFAGVVVVNRPGAVLQSLGAWNIVQGSNQTHDFSAYVEGLQHVNIGEVPALLFVNDSVFEWHHGFENVRAVIEHMPLVEQIQVAAIAGRTDRYATVCHQNPWSGLAVYVSSYCFALNGPALPVLQGLQAQAQEDGLQAHLSIDSAQWGAGLPPNFREFIRAFTCYGHASFTWSGLNRYHIGDELLATKARCIYMEHRLSGEIGRDGCIIPVNARKWDRMRLYVAEKWAGFLRKLWKR